MMDEMLDCFHDHVNTCVDPLSVVSFSSQPYVFVVFLFPRGGAEEVAGRDKCGLPATGAGQGANQEDRLGAENE